MRDIEGHYAAADLVQRVETALARAGKPRDALTLDDLAPVDEFHVRGPAATEELIARLDPPPRARVLDIGAGLGGPARRLAQARGAHVTGVDLSADYVAAGTAFSRWVGLDGQVRLLTQDATDLSRFDDASFDAAWTIHAAMNIADKAALYRGVARVLRPGARFVVYDILAGDGGAITFPVPWARDASMSVLASRDAMTAHLSAAGFEVLETQDRTADGIAFFDRALAAYADGPPPLGLHLVMGPDFPRMIANVRQAFVAGHAVLAILVCRGARAGAPRATAP